MTPDPGNFEFDTQNRGEEGEKQEAVEKQDPGCEEAKLAKAALHPRGSTGGENRDLNAVVSNNFESLFLDSGLDRVLDGSGGARGRLTAAVGLRGCASSTRTLSPAVCGGIENGPGEDNRLFESNGHDEEWKAFRQQKHIDGNTDFRGHQKTEQEGEDA